MEKLQNTMTDIQKKLLSMQDKKYKNFHEKLMPTVPSETVIGIKVPVLRALSKEYFNTAESKVFLSALPHLYYEENNLHAFLIERINDFDECIKEVERFLPFVDNWATCDSLRPKCFKKNTEKLLPCIEKWLCSSHTYTVRFGIECLMVYFLDEHFEMRFPERISKIQSDEYYVNMMTAWYFQAALTKRYDELLPFLTEHKLPVWVHNKTIQKCIESYRFTKEQKEYFRTLKRLS